VSFQHLLNYIKAPVFLQVQQALIFKTENTVFLPCLSLSNRVAV